MINVVYEKQVLFLDTVHLVNVMDKKPAFLHLFESVLLFESILFLTLVPKILRSIFEDYGSNINRMQMVQIIG